MQPWKLIKDHKIEWEYPSALPLSMWGSATLSKENPYMQADHWQTDPKLIDDFDNEIRDRIDTISYHAYDDNTLCRRFISYNDNLIYINLSKDGTLNVTISSLDKDQGKQAIKWLKKFFPISERVQNQTIQIDFWNMTSRGATSIARNLSVPSWGEIEQNYPTNVRNPLNDLMHNFVPGRGGQLILWEGKPGTGKSYALRSLIWEWREWAKPQYIVDPDVFFGQRSDYMMQVLLDDNADNPWGFEDDEEAKDMWRLLIMEDTGELLSMDAKNRTGQGFSRLLNVVDGLIGQGLKILILITTNEDIRNLDPAVKRPGRCAMKQRFGEFSTEDEIREWYQAYDKEIPEKLPRSITLAELFSNVQDLNIPLEERFGFVA